MKKTISLLALLLLFSIKIHAQVTNVLNNFYTVWVKEKYNNEIMESAIFLRVIEELII